MYYFDGLQGKAGKIRIFRYNVLFCRIKLGLNPNLEHNVVRKFVKSLMQLSPKTISSFKS